MRKLVASLALVGLATAGANGTAQAQQGAPRVFTQSGSWSLDYGDDYCRLAGNFTNGSDRIALAIERIQPGTGMRLALVGNAVKVFRTADELGFRYLPEGTERKLRYVKSEVGGGEQYLLFDNVSFVAPPAMPGPGGPGARPASPPAGAAQGAPPMPPPYDPAAERAAGKAVTGFALAAGLTEPVEVRTGAMDAPVKALQDCTDDMIKSWGLDPAKHAAPHRPPVPAGPAFEWIPNGTIGFQDFARFGGGLNQIRVMVDATGKPTGCHVHFPSLEAAKNAAICKGVMEKGKFTPAAAQGGEAMASFTFLPPFSLTRPMGGGRRR